jgi:hypothetical protein
MKIAILVPQHWTAKKLGFQITSCIEQIFVSWFMHEGWILVLIKELLCNISISITAFAVCYPDPGE